MPASSIRRARRTRASVSQVCGGIPYCFLNARSRAKGLVPSSAANVSSVGGSAMRLSSTARARSASWAPADRGARAGSTLPWRLSSRATMIRSMLSAASALPSSAARCTSPMSRAASGSRTLVSAKPTVPRSRVVSAAMSLITCADGYSVAYTQPSGAPARAVCGTSGLIMTTVPGPACTVPPGSPTSSTPRVMVPKT